MTDGLRITLVLGHQLPFPPLQGGGVNNLLWMLARQLARLGHAVTVCSPIAEGLNREEIDRYGIHHYRLPGAPMRRGAWPNNLAGLPYTFHVWKRLPLADVTSFHAPFSFLLRHRKRIGICTHTIHRTPKFWRPPTLNGVNHAIACLGVVRVWPSASNNVAHGALMLPSGRVRRSASSVRSDAFPSLP